LVDAKSAEIDLEALFKKLAECYKKGDVKIKLKKEQFMACIESMKGEIQTDFSAALESEGIYFNNDNKPSYDAIVQYVNEWYKENK